MTKEQKQKREKRILWISFYAGLAFAVTEFLFAIFSSSQSVLMDAVYDSSELIFIALIICLTPLFYKPISEERPYGYYQLESIFLIIKGIMLLSVTLGVSAEIIESALSGGNPVNEMQIAFFQLFLGILSIGIYFLLKHMNHALCSPTIEAEIMEWKLDIAYSIGLSVAFFASTYLENTKLAFLTPYFDPIVAVVVVLLMLPENIRMLKDALKDVFLFSPDEETVEEIREICNQVMENEKIKPRFVDITRTGRRLWIAVYFETEAENLSVADIRRITKTVSEEVKKIYPSSCCELILSP